MRAALWGLPFSVGFIVLRSFVAAFGHARAILVAALVAALINIPDVVGTDLRRPRHPRHGHPRCRHRASPSPSH